MATSQLQSFQAILKSDLGKVERAVRGTHTCGYTLHITHTQNTCTHTHTYTHTHTHIQTDKCTHTYTHTHACMPLRKNWRSRVFAHKCA